MSKIRDIFDIVIVYIVAIVGITIAGLLDIDFEGSFLVWGRISWTNIGIYYCILLIPVIIFLIRKEKISEYGFFKEKLERQIFIGLVMGVVLSFVIIMMLCLLGFENKLTVEYLELKTILYYLFVVAVVEELLFRGIIYFKIKKYCDSEAMAIVASSLLFACSHYIKGQNGLILIAIIFSSLICLLRFKIKSCSTLSLIIAHGIGYSMFNVWILNGLA